MIEIKNLNKRLDDESKRRYKAEENGNMIARKYLEANENVKTLSTIQFLSLDLTKTTDVDINIIGEFAPKTDMAAVTKLLTQFGDAAKTTKAPYGVLVDFAKNYKVTSEGLTAKISSLVTKASLEKLVETKGAPEQK